MAAEVHPSVAHWADQIAGLLRVEIDAGRLVRISLPGAAVPILVEDAERWLDLLVVRDGQGATYYAASPAGLVVICDPREPARPDGKAYWMQVDE